jgi:hypothetical protein
MVVLEISCFNTTEVGGYCRERVLSHQHFDRLRQAAQDANGQPLLNMIDQMDVQKRHQKD